ncbi:unnamed protein product [Peniophora sp. CBMAI 1063]|nr:unnamed protein product [Peniophora sp. CBMAI 1063]
MANISFTYKDGKEIVQDVGKTGPTHVQGQSGERTDNTVAAAHAINERVANNPELGTQQLHQQTESAQRHVIAHDGHSTKVSGMSPADPRRVVHAWVAGAHGVMGQHRAQNAEQTLKITERQKNDVGKMTAETSKYQGAGKDGMDAYGNKGKGKGKAKDGRR